MRLSEIRGIIKKEIRKILEDISTVGGTSIDVAKKKATDTSVSPRSYPDVRQGHEKLTLQGGTKNTYDRTKGERDQTLKLIEFAIKLVPKESEEYVELNKWLNKAKEGMLLFPNDKNRISNLYSKYLKESKMGIRKFIKEEITRVMNNQTKDYAKAAIRDIFLQFSSRGVPKETWKGLSESVIGYFGNDNYQIALTELLNDGWIEFTDHRVEWRKSFGPVNELKKKIVEHGYSNGMELASAANRPIRSLYTPPSSEKDPDPERAPSLYKMKEVKKNTILTPPEKTEVMHFSGWITPSGETIFNDRTGSHRESLEKWLKEHKIEMHIEDAMWNGFIWMNTTKDELWFELIQDVAEVAQNWVRINISSGNIIKTVHYQIFAKGQTPRMITRPIKECSSKIKIKELKKIVKTSIKEELIRRMISKIINEELEKNELNEDWKSLLSGALLTAYTLFGANFKPAQAQDLPIPKNTDTLQVSNTNMKLAKYVIANKAVLIYKSIDGSIKMLIAFPYMRNANLAKTTATVTAKTAFDLYRNSVQGLELSSPLLQDIKPSDDGTLLIAMFEISK